MGSTDATLAMTAVGRGVLRKEGHHRGSLCVGSQKEGKGLHLAAASNTT